MSNALTNGCPTPTLAFGGNVGPVMVKSRYHYLVQQRNRWFVRIIVPPEVREILGVSVFKVPTGQTDKFRAASLSTAIIADLKQRIKIARDAGKQVEQLPAEQLAERYRKESEVDPDKAEITKLTAVIAFALKSHGHTWSDHAKRVRAANYDLHAALRLLPNGDAAARTADKITGLSTPLLTYLKR